MLPLTITEVVFADGSVHQRYNHGGYLGHMEFDIPDCELCTPTYVRQLKIKTEE